VISVDVENRSGAEVDERGAVELAERVLQAEGIDEGELGIAFVGADEMRTIDGRDEMPEGMPRALGDVVLCPQVVGAEWRWPLTHGLLHLLGYDHGEEMETREQEHLA
jgi:probable rRNA maturation factor